MLSTSVGAGSSTLPESVGNGSSAFTHAYGLPSSRTNHRAESTNLNPSRCVLTISFLKPLLLPLACCFNECSQPLTPNNVWAISACNGPCFRCFCNAAMYGCDRALNLSFIMFTLYLVCLVYALPGTQRRRLPRPGMDMPSGASRHFNNILHLPSNCLLGEIPDPHVFLHAGILITCRRIPWFRWHPSAQGWFYVLRPQLHNSTRGISPTRQDHWAA